MYMTSQNKILTASFRDGFPNVCQKNVTTPLQDFQIPQNFILSINNLPLGCNHFTGD